jgi:hypothetical protein
MQNEKLINAYKKSVKNCDVLLSALRQRRKEIKVRLASSNDSTTWIGSKKSIQREERLRDNAQEYKIIETRRQCYIQFIIDLDGII